jgi:CHASE3 domain sensor protein
MDLTSTADSKAVRIACALALATICLAISFRSALRHSSVTVKRSVVSGVTAVEKIDSIMSNLNRLTVNQRAFLSTGDEYFTEEVAESIMTMSHDIDTLTQISTNRAPLQRYVTTLSHRLKLAMDSIRETYDLQQHFGSTVAIEVLDDDDAVDNAKQTALLLKRIATDGMFDRVKTEYGWGSFLNVLF